MSHVLAAHATPYPGGAPAVSYPEGQFQVLSPLRQASSTSNTCAVDLEDRISTAAPSDSSSPPLGYMRVPEGQQLLRELEGSSGTDCLPRTPSLPRKLDTEHMHRVRQQVEYYFSVPNVSRDPYLRSRMDLFGWVSLQEIVFFPRMRRMGVNAEQVAEALLGSMTVEVCWDMQHVRILDPDSRSCFVPPPPPLLLPPQPLAGPPNPGAGWAAAAPVGQEVGPWPRPGWEAAMPQQWATQTGLGAAGQSLGRGCGQKADPQPPSAQLLPERRMHPKQSPRCSNAGGHVPSTNPDQSQGSANGTQLPEGKQDGEAGQPMGPAEITAWLRWGYDA